MQKTVTVDFLSHKTIPNNGEAPKFYVTDHHVPIINRAVWMRAQEILAHRKKNRTKKKDEKREKRVGKDVFDNLVCGKCGAPFYRRTLQARATHFEDDRCLDACRSELLAQGSSPDDYYERLLLNSVDRCIAIRPCEKSNPNAIRWGRLKEGRWCASTLGCRGLAKALFDIMEWDEDLKYRFRGQLVEQGGDKLMLFELDEPEMIKVEEIVLPPKEEESEGETVKKTIYIFPPEWAGTFGQPITSVAQIGILQQEHYAGNWDVLRPASEIKEMNIFTADGLNTLLHEAEEIMEGWIDIDGGKQNVNAAEGAGIGD